MAKRNSTLTRAELTRWRAQKAEIERAERAVQRAETKLAAARQALHRALGSPPTTSKAQKLLALLREAAAPEPDRLLHPRPRGRARHVRLDAVLAQCTRMLKDGVPGDEPHLSPVAAASLCALRFLERAVPTPVVDETDDAAFITKMQREARPALERPLTAKRIMIAAAQHLGMKRADNLFARRDSS